jgi:hypothetical protein
MAQHSIVVIGLPGSGKTTFLAALWHLIFSRETPAPMRLKFGSLKQGNQKHLNAIAARWRNAQMQERTQVAGNQLVSINLLTTDGGEVNITFPDMAGEAYSQMWEDRECDKTVADTLMEGRVLLFVHADAINQPLWIHEVGEMAEMLGEPLNSDEEPVPWHPKLAPTQVQLVGLLNLLSEPPLHVGPRRIVVMLSAWDKAKGEGLTPRDFLRAKLPLLSQYLDTNTQNWECHVYGVSAQGGDYDDVKPDSPKTAAAAELRAINLPSDRIELVDDGATTNDLTQPIAWLLT